MSNPHAFPSAMPPGPLPNCTVTVVIKALNEERHIEASIESALRGVASLGGEVVLADSCSTDQTIALAMAYPIRIVQLLDPDERSCGIGPQVGYQHSLGEFVYIMDGDMQLIEGFLEQAVAILRTRPELAGVGGRLVELNTASLEYVMREARAARQPVAVIVDRLDCGGLYRREAIESAGYFSDRNLHSYEEYDLATRLRAAGWKLMRVPEGAITHFGHDAPPYELLVRRFKTGYVCGPGELVRAAVGQPRFIDVLRGLKELRLYIAVLLWWAVLASALFWPLAPPARIALAALVLALPFGVMAWRKKSFVQARYAVVSWCFHTAGMLIGLFRPQRPPRERIATRILREPVSRPASCVLHGAQRQPDGESLSREMSRAQ